MHLISAALGWYADTEAEQRYSTRAGAKTNRKRQHARLASDGGANDRSVPQAVFRADHRSEWPKCFHAVGRSISRRSRPGYNLYSSYLAIVPRDRAPPLSDVNRNGDAHFCS